MLSGRVITWELSPHFTYLHIFTYISSILGWLSFIEHVAAWPPAFPPAQPLRIFIHIYQAQGKPASMWLVGQTYRILKDRPANVTSSERRVPVKLLLWSPLQGGHSAGGARGFSSRDPMAAWPLRPDPAEPGISPSYSYFHVSTLSMWVYSIERKATSPMYLHKRNEKTHTLVPTQSDLPYLQARIPATTQAGHVS